MMLAERNAAANTRLAYQRDLTDAALFMAKRKIDFDQANEEDIRAYIVGLKDASARTQARRLSALRQYFRFLASEKTRLEDPTRNIDAPKTGRSLPKYLSEDEVLLLLKAVQKMPGYEGARLCAMMELLYAGLRVTELVSLPLGAILFDRGLVQVRGKGGKDRVVPLGDPAIAALRDWMEFRKAGLKAGGGTLMKTFLFPSTHAKTGYITRQRFSNF